MRKILTATALILLAQGALAKPTLDVPYYASIRADKAHVRTGPSVRYPIQWVYQRENWPVEVVATFERWRKIKDINGEAGWIHESLLSRKRNVLIKTNGVQELFRLPIPTSAVVMVAEDGVVADLVSCKEEWCKIDIAGEKGWIKANHLWGVEEGEVVE